MKRSAQVALVLMGVTGTTATAAYMMPPRPECRAQPAAATASPAAALPQAAAPQNEPCRRRSSSGSSGGRSSWGSWNWHYGSSSGRDRIRPSGQPSSSVSTAFSSSSSGSRVNAVSSSSGSSVARGGFGSTGHGTAAAS